MSGSGVMAAFVRSPSSCAPSMGYTMDVAYTAGRTAEPGTRNLAFKYEGKTYSLSPSVDVKDATPQIDTVEQTDPTAPEGPFQIIIRGRNFGKLGLGSKVYICAQGAPEPCNSVAGVSITAYETVQNWSDTEITATVVPSQPGTKGVFDIQVGSGGALGYEFKPAPAGGSTRRSNRKAITIWRVEMKLEQVGPTVISTDGNYSEDTTVRVTAVRSDYGATISDFTGTVNIAEEPAGDGTTIYSQHGGTLAASVEITSGGSVTFVAKSLAGPKAEGSSGEAPDAAQIKTTNYPVRGNHLPIPQWIISATPLDSRSSGPVYDWVQARVRDAFNAATGDVQIVLSAISSYTMSAGDYSGKTFLQHGHQQSRITINPYSSAQRTDSAPPGSTLCGQGFTKSFTDTLLHEARHAYQGSQTAAGNDGDLDWLVKSIGVAPIGIFIDTTAFRNVCDDSQGFPGIVLSVAYHGDSIPDTYSAPDFVSYATEMDAVVFASNHGN